MMLEEDLNSGMALKMDLLYEREELEEKLEELRSENTDVLEIASSENFDWDAVHRTLLAMKS